MDTMEDENDGQYRWEGIYERPWESLKVDESGSLQASVSSAAYENRRDELFRRRANVRLGIMRQICILIDMSSSMNDRDLPPTRLLHCVKQFSMVLDDFYDQNPVSQICIIASRDKKAEQLCEFSCNPTVSRQALVNAMELEGTGEFSIQNSLNLAIDLLKHTPSHCSREVLIIVGSIGTCDPGDIFSTLKLLQQNRIVCNVIALSAEVYLYKKICSDTGGKHLVIVDAADFKDSLALLTVPPAVTKQIDATLVKMGFPQRVESEDRWAFCVCHAMCDPAACLTAIGYFCPQCNAKYCSLPTECRVCGLTLIAAQHLARSHQQLFPIDPFDLVEVTLESTCTSCFGCFELIDIRAYVCSKCKNHFCIDCNFLIHETMHVCPGC